MAAAKTLKLPVIDFSDLKEGTPRWESVRTQVRNALEEYGCFEALYEDISQHLRKSALAGIQRLFDLPLEIKTQNNSDKLFHGYVGQIPKLPLFESMGIDDPVTFEKVESFTNRFWSEGDPTFSESIHSFSKKLSEVDKNLRRMVLESFELEKYMDEHMNSTNYLVRVQKYSAPHSNENKIGLALHTDMNPLSILCQNEVDGLEILTKDGQWIDAKPSSNSYIVIVGDAFHAWTNGRLHSVEHRAVVKGDVDRYSIGLFSIPKAGYIIKPPEELVDEEHPLLFKPYDHAKFVKFFYSRQGQKSLAALKEYCEAI